MTTYLALNTSINPEFHQIEISAIPPYDIKCTSFAFSGQKNYELDITYIGDKGAITFVNIIIYEIKIMVQSKEVKDEKHNIDEEDGKDNDVKEFIEMVYFNSLKKQENYTQKNEEKIDDDTIF